MTPPRFSDLAVGDAAFLEISLVVLLSAPEFRRGRDLGNDRSPVAAALLEPLLRRRRLLLLRLVVEKTAERYCVPTSGPWRFNVVGSWFSQKTSRSCPKETRSGSNSTCTLSAWPVRPVQTSSYVGSGSFPPNTPRRRQGLPALAGTRTQPPEAPRRERGFLGHGSILPCSRNTPSQVARFPTPRRMLPEPRAAPALEDAGYSLHRPSCRSVRAAGDNSVHGSRPFHRSPTPLRAPGFPAGAGGGRPSGARWP